MKTLFLTILIIISSPNVLLLSQQELRNEIGLLKNQIGWLRVSINALETKLDSLIKSLPKKQAENINTNTEKRFTIKFSAKERCGRYDNYGTILSELKIIVELYKIKYFEYQIKDYCDGLKYREIDGEIGIFFDFDDALDFKAKLPKGLKSQIINLLE